MSAIEARRRQVGAPPAGFKWQWNAHDKAGGRAATRRLRQAAAQRVKMTTRAVGVAVDEDGLTPAGLFVPGFAKETE